MRSPHVPIATLMAMFATSLWAVAQSVPQQPEALDLLRNVGLTYRAMTTYSAKMTIMTEMNGPNLAQKMERPSTLVADSSGKMRMESTGSTGLTLIFDGKTLWMYLPAENKYMKTPYGGKSLGSPSEGTTFPGTNSLLEYQGLSAGAKEAKVLRSEKLHVHGADTDCWVVSVVYEPLSRQVYSGVSSGAPIAEVSRAELLWVEKSHYLVYREETTSEITRAGDTEPMYFRNTILFETVTIDQPVPENTFSFTPPADATELEMSGLTNSVN